MKPQNIRIAVYTLATVLAATAAFSAPDPAVVNETFAGKYRAPVKTAIARPAPVREYANVAVLLQSLPKDSAMRSKYPALRPHIKNWPKQREPEEMINVKIDNAWIVAVKHEHSATGDNDFHIVVADSPAKPFNHVMNMEVAGLPKTGPDVTGLKNVRVAFLSFFTSTPPSGAFRAVKPPIHVSVEGSFYFDGEHTAGGKSDPGPAWAKPKTVWEVHPISKITRLNP